MYIFLGRHCRVVQRILITSFVDTIDAIDILDDANCDDISHVSIFASIFLDYGSIFYAQLAYLKDHAMRGTIVTGRIDR